MPGWSPSRNYLVVNIAAVAVFDCVPCKVNSGPQMARWQHNLGTSGGIH